MENTLEIVMIEKYLSFFVSDRSYDADYINNEICNTYARGKGAVPIEKN